MELNLSIVEVVVIISSGTDKVVAKFEGESQYPTWQPDMIPYFSMDVAKGHGIAYAEKMFGLIPKVIHTK